MFFFSFFIAFSIFTLGVVIVLVLWPMTLTKVLSCRNWKFEQEWIRGKKIYWTVLLYLHPCDNTFWTEVEKKFMWCLISRYSFWSIGRPASVSEQKADIECMCMPYSFRSSYVLHHLPQDKEVRGIKKIKNDSHFGYVQ